MLNYGNNFTHKTNTHGCEDIVRLAQDVFIISFGVHFHLYCSHVHITAQRPEVRLMDTVHTLQLAHL